jgi:hypothetical protein
MKRQLVTRNIVERVELFPQQKASLASGKPACVIRNQLENTSKRRNIIVKRDAK